MKNRIFVILLYSLWFMVYGLSGCGYSTKGFVYKEDRIVIKPVINKVDITSESRRNSNYTVSPILLEKRLTNTIVNKFNVFGYLKVVSSEKDALVLSCKITNYQKESLRYTDSKNVQEQRLRLMVDMKLVDSQGEVLKEKQVVGETSYYLSGTHQTTEESAQTDLIDDAARRILEAVVEEW
ncbi:MAG: hypothetical protein JSV34_02245 [Candidatus Omnitrophota bacterium]|nr:MAG: hypothetical protein JSV34_02245 [Candidatus Omnitrophota bacterium]